MRTTLTIDDDVTMRLEKLRDDREESFKAVVNDVLRRGLDAIEQPGKERPKYRINPVSLGRCRLPSIDKTSDVIAFAEGDWHR